MKRFRSRWILAALAFLAVSSLFPRGALASLRASYPFPLPSTYKINQGYLFGTYDPAIAKTHNGVDIGSGSSGVDVYAVAGGNVTIPAYDADGYGNYIVINHDDGFQSLYAHLSQILVSNGRVEAGALIGRTGQTGKVTGAHLHFEIRCGSKSYNDASNPEMYLARSETGNGAIYGTVTDSSGAFIRGATLSGLRKPYPEFTVANTYRLNNNGVDNYDVRVLSINYYIGYVYQTSGTTETISAPGYVTYSQTFRVGASSRTRYDIVLQKQ